MVSSTPPQITLKTEGPHWHGFKLPSDRLPAEHVRRTRRLIRVRPMVRSQACFILADYDAVSACHSREVSRHWAGVRERSGSES